MRCPKCGFITFDHAVTCAKCKTDLQNVGGGFQGTSVNVKPPSLLGSVTKQAPEPSVDDMLEGEGMSFDDSPTGGESLELLSDDDLEVTDDLSDIDLNELSSLESDDSTDDDAIQSLEPMSGATGFVDEAPLPQLDKISSELSDIDISDLVAPDDLEEDNIPSLEPVGDALAEELTALEPLADEETEIPALAPLEDTETVAELSPLSSVDDALDDLDLAADDFEDDDLSSLLDDSGLDDLDFGEETMEGSVAVPEVQPLEQADPLETLDGGYDLSFDEADAEPGPLAAEDTAVELSLDLDESPGDQPLKTPSPPNAPDIPDLGLTLESDQE